MRIYSVYRIGKCVKCSQDVTEFLGDFEAENEKESINKAQSEWSFDNFGQAGAIRENEITEEKVFLDAEFEAKER